MATVTLATNIAKSPAISVIPAENLQEKNSTKVPGPQPLTIGEYKARQAKARDSRLTAIPATEAPPKRRGGARARAQRRRYTIIGILKEGGANHEAQQILKAQLKFINKELHKKKKNKINTT